MHMPGTPRRNARSLVLARPAILVVLPMLLATNVACEAPRGFRCGSRLDGQDSVVQSCTEPREVCVCATNSCAVRIDSMENPTCPGGGLMYVDEPFAATDVANTCVPEIHSKWIIAEENVGATCQPTSASTGGSGGTQATTSGGASGHAGAGTSAGGAEP